jgi:hypothetical protein
VTPADVDTLLFVIAISGAAIALGGLAWIELTDRRNERRRRDRKNGRKL